MALNGTRNCYRSELDNRGRYDMGKRSAKIDKNREKIGLKELFNTHIFGKLLHMNINCQQK
jgi:hypothetical protein